MAAALFQKTLDALQAAMPTMWPLAARKNRHKPSGRGILYYL